jgi:hypothetical protein
MMPPHSEILSFSSRFKKNAMRMLHVPSLTVFQNWPTSGSSGVFFGQDKIEALT